MATTLDYMLLLAVYLCSVCDCENNDPVVTLADGKVKGTLKQTVVEGKPYYAFRGIPYAQPPLGELRFQPPSRNSNWEGVLDGTEDGSECTQGDSSSVTGSEDCLFINVYTPTLEKKKLPVLVWIYGGSFTTGGSTYKLQAPDLILEENVIFVQFNYRVGVFGFISTGDLVAPGNIGLKDQVLALKWVQSNIHEFGGDADSVTIFGESAGAASVSYHLQSPASKGLFKAAIMDSGTSLCLWALNRRARRTAFEIGKKLGINVANSTTLMEGLRTIDASTLQKISTLVSTLITYENPLAGINFGPVIEPCHEAAFFCNYSEQQLSSGNFHQVPVLLGFNSKEAAGIADIPVILRPFFAKYHIDVSLLAPIDLTTNSTKKKSAALEIKQHFMGSVPVIAISRDDLVQFISSDQFVRPIRKTALDMAKYVPVYFYEFSYQGALGDAADAGKDKSRGVGHAEELGYIFYRKPANATVTANDELVRKRVVRMWTNLAKHNNPTPVKDPLLQNVTWVPSPPTYDNVTYLNIDLNLTVKANPYNEDMRFYDEIYQKFGDPPYTTY